MRRFLEHTAVSFLLGVILAGPAAAVTLVLLAPAWRHPMVAWAVAAAVLGVVVACRGVRPPSA